MLTLLAGCAAAPREAAPHTYGEVPRDTYGNPAIAALAPAPPPLGPPPPAASRTKLPKAERPISCLHFRRCL